MEYKLENEYNSAVKVKHELNNPFITIYVSQGDSDDLPNYSSIGIDLKKEQLHEFIGTLLHVQSKMRK